MKRYFKIFLISFEDAFESRSRSFVWFLLSLANPLIALLYWRGSFTAGSSTRPLGSWTLEDISTYYFLLVIMGSLLVSHTEDEVARIDIQNGGLSRYLLKPFSYFIMRLFSEIPWRLIQACFGLITLTIFIFLFGNFLSVAIPFQAILVLPIILFSSYLLSFTFKMLVGISALWITEYSGLIELIDVLMIVFAGFVMPILLFPEPLKSIALTLPFSSIIYFPVMTVLGKLTPQEFTRMFITQLVWLGFFLLLFRFLWGKGVKKFTGLGQ